jgi:hypothetical protein
MKGKGKERTQSRKEQRALYIANQHGPSSVSEVKITEVSANSAIIAFGFSGKSN